MTTTTREDPQMAVREAENDASALLASSWWTSVDHGEPLPIDPVLLAQRLGIAVRVISLPGDESGNISIPPDGQAIISLNAFDHPNRQRFTCAHEIGHYRRRSASGEAGTRRFVDHRDTLAGLGTDSEEIYANQFAAALLMPGHLVRQYSQDGWPAERMAAAFETSVQAMNVRLRNLRLIR